MANGNQQLKEGTTDEAENKLRALNGRIKGFHFSIDSSEQFLSQERMCPVCPLGEENRIPPAV